MKNQVNNIIIIAIIFIILLVDACSPKNELSVNNFKFDGPLGSEGAKVEKIEKNVFKITLGHAPNQPEWNNKLNFQITGNAKGNDLVLIVEGPPKYPMNEYFYSWSYDMKNWNPVQWKNGFRISPKKDTLSFPIYEQNQVWVGHQVPISYNQIEEYISIIRQNNNVTVDTLGKSLGGRNLYRITITDDNSNILAKDKWVHYFINPHPGEHNAQWRMIGKINWLLSEEGEKLRERSICHFVLMMSPDGPHNGWYRVNAQGIDMNRSYFPDGSDSINQAHESYIFQHDLEKIMSSESPVTTLWGHHTWGGIVDPLLYFIEDKRLPSWTKWKDILLELDGSTLINPLALRESKPSSTSWENGAHIQFNITTVLCEGGGDIYTKDENIKSGKILMQSIDRYFEGSKKH